MRRISKGDYVIVKRDIIRLEGLYAVKGEKGVVKDTFDTHQSGGGTVIWHAQVKMNDGKLKTFKLTSLEKTCP